jgi:hypothetical protein
MPEHFKVMPVHKGPRSPERDPWPKKPLENGSSSPERSVFEVQKLAPKKKRMSLGQAVANRDAVVLGTIFAAFDKIGLSEKQKMKLSKVVEEAYDLGAREWENKYLELALGPVEARRIKRTFAGSSPSVRGKP